MTQNERRDEGERIRWRTCVGCGLRDDASALVRLVVEHGDVTFDLGRRAVGRGAHLHARPSCLKRAPRRLPRALRLRAPVGHEELGRRLAVACDERIRRLLLAGRRRGELGASSDVSIPLVVVAVDSRSVASDALVVAAVAAGRAIAWGTRETLGELLGWQAAEFCGVRGVTMAAELKKMRVAADAGAAAAREGAGCSSRSPEAR